MELEEWETLVPYALTPRKSKIVTTWYTYWFRVMRVTKNIHSSNQHSGTELCNGDMVCFQWSRIWIFKYYMRTTVFASLIYALRITDSIYDSKFGKYNRLQSLYSSVIIVTTLRTTCSRNYASTPSRGKIFIFSPGRPDRIWGPNSPLFNGYQETFRPVKGQASDAVLSPHLAQTLRISTAILELQHTPSWRTTQGHVYL
jgi:hypothetical protein